MPTVTAIARFDALSEFCVRLYGEMDSPPDANNLSGMSGGPIFWSDVDGWGLVGIVKKGKDVHPVLQAEGTPIFEGATVLLDGEPLPPSILDDLIAQIPEDDPAIPYYAPHLFIVDPSRRV
ncbi:hypothetical protein [Caballeronia sp. GaOx3]|uniref:hypothetical protein n=1 Tax=Caballeronia sp. GaOx3 TaxID=2921740 RepID=UPI002028D44B|nr:hypothetical protein [Caballeronia sp. GaOx3]